ncbi:unnamed protein product [Parascedosporium putredinis]|uniref:Iron permease FTR1 n=1 Tax=Parascedosporium putredinis TaxID=1442378 RepID=A0A9P1M763_9PEZI|nr:unnamed protein product [Parascedosporium putredinis]CAI7991049.1 unnamed protein product [Parascedosporium putredinis]
MLTDLFSVPIFLVVFRETLETAIIVSVLLAFLKQTLRRPGEEQQLHNTFRRQVCAARAPRMARHGRRVLHLHDHRRRHHRHLYGWGKDAWGEQEYYYEGIFSLISSVVITIMGVALLRIGRMQEKWRAKLAKAIEAPITSAVGQPWLKRVFEKYSMFILPFITILREGIEGIVFVAGVSFSAPASAIPLAVLAGLLLGTAVGYVIYMGGSIAKIQTFLVFSTCFLYLIAAGLFSRAFWCFETQQWNKVIGGDAAELGDGPGSYDIDRSVWHVNCCSPKLNGGGGWGVLNAIFGWTNSATYGSVISYNLYWAVVISAFVVLRYREAHGGVALPQDSNSFAITLRRVRTHHD